VELTPIEKLSKTKIYASERTDTASQEGTNDGSRQLCAEKIDPGYFDKK
jgi:hypothetical protein